MASNKHQRTAALTKAAHSMQEGQARSLDALAEFETFREIFAPEIRKDLMKGLSGEAIIAKYKPLAMARLAQVAVAGDTKDSINATRELLDRVDGKPKAQVEHTHKLARLSDEELDALVDSQTKALATLEAQAITVSDITNEVVEDEPSDE